MRRVILPLFVTILLMLMAIFPSALSDSPPIAVPSGLVSWWPGDGNALDIWDCNNGTLMNGATFGSGLVDQAFSLDGIDDYVDLGTGNNLNFPTNDFTIDFWVNFRNTSSEEQVMIEKYIETYGHDYPRTGWTCTSIFSENVVRLHLADTTTSNWNVLDVTPPTILNNTWIHAAFTRNGDNFTIYWNGVPLGSAIFSGINLNTWASLKLGHRGNPDDPWPSNSTGSIDYRNFFLNGLIDEVEIYNRALSSQEIYAIYNAGSAGKVKLGASISPLSASMLVGQSVAFTSTVSGGYAPYGYQWYLNDALVSGAMSNMWIFTPTTSGIYYVHLKVTDAEGNTAQSETSRITVATVPVGGYSIPMQPQTAAKPIILHVAILMALTAIFMKLKPKSKRKH